MDEFVNENALEIYNYVKPKFMKILWKLFPIVTRVFFNAFLKHVGSRSKLIALDCTMPKFYCRAVTTAQLTTLLLILRACC